MATNKTKPVETSVAAFIAALPDARTRADTETLVAMMQRITGEPPKMWGTSIVGFGLHHYVYESGREGDMALVSFAPRKAAIVIYNALGEDGDDAMLAKLGKHKTGKGCLYIKTLADVDTKILEALLTRAVASLRAR